MPRIPLVPYSDSEPSSPVAEKHAKISPTRKIYQQQPPPKPQLGPQPQIQQRPQLAAQQQQPAQQPQPQQQQSKPKVEEVIKWIEQFLDLKHPFFPASPDELLASPSTFLPWADPPPSVEPPLSNHLDGLTAELSDHESLGHRIMTHLRDNTFAKQLDAALNEEMLALGFNREYIAACNKKNVTEKVKAIRDRRHHLPKQTPDRKDSHRSTAKEQREMLVGVVAAVKRNGAADEVVWLRLPESTIWPVFLRALTRTTAGWQAAMNGHPTGYTLEDGPWMYCTQPNPNDLRALMNEKDYAKLKKAIRHEQGAIVWHDITRKQAKEWNMEHEALRNRAFYPDHEPKDENGEPYFLPTFEVEDLLRFPDKLGNFLRSET